MLLQTLEVFGRCRRGLNDGFFQVGISNQLEFFAMQLIPSSGAWRRGSLEGNINDIVFVCAWIVI